MTILAIDYGDARIGLALSDPTATLTGDAWTLRETNATRAAAKIADIVKEREVDALVLGLPRNMDGSEGFRADKTRAFGALLTQKTALPIVYWDERLTTVDANRILRESPARKRRLSAATRRNVDSVAASLILEGYLNSMR